MLNYLAEDDHFRLKDLGSTNKTWVNGMCLRDLFKDADNVRFRSVQCVFEYQEENAK